MRIESIEIENFRSIKQETIRLDPMTALVGPNGSGKSTVLAALNAFFGFKSDTGRDHSLLEREDFHLGKTSDPVQITITFTSLSGAESALSHYVRNGKLVVTAEATFDDAKGIAPITHVGQRLGLPEIATYFDADKNGDKAPELKKIFADIRSNHPDIVDASTKANMAEALHNYEATLDPNELSLLRSADEFYGSSSTSGKLRPYIEWVYVPAVKDASVEAAESEGPALRALVARAISNRSGLNEKIEVLRRETRGKLTAILDESKPELEILAKRLESRLQDWSKPDAKVGMSWKDDGDKSVKLINPQAGVQVGDSQFLGELSRQGHGLQRSYLLALLEELSHGGSEAGENAAQVPTLVLGIEEPELYQHPPQARKLSSVLERLAQSGDQTILTTHSPIFVSGEGFSRVRLVRRPQNSPATQVKAATADGVLKRVKAIHGEDTEISAKQLVGARAKLHQALTPSLSEMFFCPRIVFVEGYEDMAYILSWIAFTERGDAFLASEFELIPTLAKSNMIQPGVVAELLGIPSFFVFDGDCDSRENDKNGAAAKHRRDNAALAELCGAKLHDGFPTGSDLGKRHQVWENNIGYTFRVEMSESLGAEKFTKLENALRDEFGHTKDVNKNTLFIEALVENCIGAGGKAPSFDELCANLCGQSQPEKSDA